MAAFAAGVRNHFLGEPSLHNSSSLTAVHHAHVGRMRIDRSSVARRVRHVTLGDSICRAISAGLYAPIARRQYSCVTVDAACLPDEHRIALLQQGGWLRIITTADGAELHAWCIGATPAPTSLAVCGCSAVVCGFFDGSLRCGPAVLAHGIRHASPQCKSH